MNATDNQRFEYKQIFHPYKVGCSDRIDFINLSAKKGWRFVGSFVQKHKLRSYHNGNHNLPEKDVATECMTFEREVS